MDWIRFKFLQPILFTLVCPSFAICQDQPSKYIAAGAGIGSLPIYFNFPYLTYEAEFGIPLPNKLIATATLGSGRGYYKTHEQFSATKTALNVLYPITKNDRLKLGAGLAWVSISTGTRTRETRRFGVITNQEHALWNGDRFGSNFIIDYQVPTAPNQALAIRLTVQPLFEDFFALGHVNNSIVVAYRVNL